MRSAIDLQQGKPGLQQKMCLSCAASSGTVLNQNVKYSNLADEQEQLNLDPAPQYTPPPIESRFAKSSEAVMISNKDGSQTHPGAPDVRGEYWGWWTKDLWTDENLYNGHL